MDGEGASANDVCPYGPLRGRRQGGEGRWEAMRARSSRPFCSCDSRWMHLRYVAAAQRYATGCAGKRVWTNVSTTRVICQSIQAIELQWAAGRRTSAASSSPSRAVSTMRQCHSRVASTPSAAVISFLLVPELTCRTAGGVRWSTNASGSAWLLPAPYVCKEVLAGGQPSEMVPQRTSVLTRRHGRHDRADTSTPSAVMLRALRCYCRRGRPI